MSQKFLTFTNYSFNIDDPRGRVIPCDIAFSSVIKSSFPPKPEGVLTVWEQTPTQTKGQIYLPFDGETLWGGYFNASLPFPPKLGPTNIINDKRPLVKFDGQKLFLFAADTNTYSSAIAGQDWSSLSSITFDNTTNEFWSDIFGVNNFRFTLNTEIVYGNNIILLFEKGKNWVIKLTPNPVPGFNNYIHKLIRLENFVWPDCCASPDDIKIREIKYDGEKFVVFTDIFNNTMNSIGVGSALTWISKIYYYFYRRPATSQEITNILSHLGVASSPGLNLDQVCEMIMYVLGFNSSTNSITNFNTEYSTHVAPIVRAFERLRNYGIPNLTHAKYNEILTAARRNNTPAPQLVAPCYIETPGPTLIWGYIPGASNVWGLTRGTIEAIDELAFSLVPIQNLEPPCFPAGACLCEELGNARQGKAACWVRLQMWPLVNVFPGDHGNCIHDYANPNFPNHSYGAHFTLYHQYASRGAYVDPNFTCYNSTTPGCGYNTIRNFEHRLATAFIRFALLNQWPTSLNNVNPVSLSEIRNILNDYITASYQNSRSYWGFASINGDKWYPLQTYNEPVNWALDNEINLIDDNFKFPYYIDNYNQTYYGFNLAARTGNSFIRDPRESHRLLYTGYIPNFSTGSVLNPEPTNYLIWDSGTIVLPNIFDSYGSQSIVNNVTSYNIFNYSIYPSIGIQSVLAYIPGGRQGVYATGAINSFNWQTGQIIGINENFAPTPRDYFRFNKSTGSNEFGIITVVSNTTSPFIYGKFTETFIPPSSSSSSSSSSTCQFGFITGYIINDMLDTSFNWGIAITGNKRIKIFEDKEMANNTAFYKEGLDESYLEDYFISPDFSITNKLKEFPVNLNGNAKKVFASKYTAYAVDCQNKAYAWGDNPYGQTNLPITTGIQKIVGNDYAGLALKTDGSCVGWGTHAWSGWNNSNNNIARRLQNIVDIDAGPTHFLALNSQGHVITWGEDGLNGGNVISLVPNKVTNNALDNFPDLSGVWFKGVTPGYKFGRSQEAEIVGGNFFKNMIYAHNKFWFTDATFYFDFPYGDTIKTSTNGSNWGGTSVLIAGNDNTFASINSDTLWGGMAYDFYQGRLFVVGGRAFISSTPPSGVEHFTSAVFNGSFWTSKNTIFSSGMPGEPPASNTSINYSPKFLRNCAFGYTPQRVVATIHNSRYLVYSTNGLDWSDRYTHPLLQYSTNKKIVYFLMSSPNLFLMISDYPSDTSERNSFHIDKSFIYSLDGVNWSPIVRPPDIKNVVWKDIALGRSSFSQRGSTATNKVVAIPDYYNYVSGQYFRNNEVHWTANGQTWGKSYIPGPTNIDWEKVTFFRDRFYIFGTTADMTPGIQKMRYTSSTDALTWDIPKIGGPNAEVVQGNFSDSPSLNPNFLRNLEFAADTNLFNTTLGVPAGNVLVCMSTSDPLYTPFYFGKPIDNENSPKNYSVASGQTSFIKISAGRKFSLGLNSNRKIITWGLGLYNQNLHGNVTDDGTEYLDIDAGYDHGLAINKDFNIRTWGIAGGLVGADSQPLQAALPFNGVGPSNGVFSIAAGLNHSILYKTNNF